MMEISVVFALVLMLEGVFASQELVGNHSCLEIVSVTPYRSDGKVDESQPICLSWPCPRDVMLLLSLEACPKNVTVQSFTSDYQQGRYVAFIGNHSASCSVVASVLPGNETETHPAVALRCNVPQPKWPINRFGYSVGAELRGANDSLVSAYVDAVHYGPIALPPVTNSSDNTSVSHKRTEVDEKDRILIAVTWDCWGLGQSVAVTHRMLRVLPDYWRFYIRVSNSAYVQYLKNPLIAASVRSGRVTLSANLPDSTSMDDYSRAQLSVDHWNAIPGDVVLTYQSDSIICSGSIYKIDDFVQFVVSLPITSCMLLNPSFFPPPFQI